MIETEKTTYDELNLLNIWKIIRSGNKYILQITSVFVILGIIYSFITTEYFLSTITLYPAVESNQSGLALGNLQGVAKAFGIGDISSTPTFNIPDIIKSRRLKKNIVLKSWSSSVYTNETNLIKYWEIDKQNWFFPYEWIAKYFSSNKYSREPKQQYLEIAIEKLNDLIFINEEFTGLITVSVLMEDPELASSIANYIAEFVKDFISVEAHRETVKNKSFIYDQQMKAKEELKLSEEELTEYRKKHPLALDTPDLLLGRGRLIRNVEANQAVYITLRQQYEMAKIEEAKEKLFVNILDVAEPAVKRAKPRRILIVIFATFIGFVFSTLFVFIDDKHYLSKS